MIEHKVLPCGCTMTWRDEGNSGDYALVVVNETCNKDHFEFMVEEEND